MALSRIPTGYDELDLLLGGGIKQSQLTVIAAGTGVGKSSLALCIGLNAALLRGAKVAIASLEMSRERVVERLLSAESSLEVEQLHSEALPDFSKMLLDMAKDRIRNSSIWISDHADLTMLELYRMAESKHRVNPFDVLIIDRLQSLSTQGFDPVLGLEQTVLALRDLSHKLKISVIATHWLDFGATGSDSIINAWTTFANDSVVSMSDVAIFMHRKDLEHAERNALERSYLSIYPFGVTKVAVTRRGISRIGECNLMFRGQFGRFESIAKLA